MEEIQEENNLEFVKHYATKKKRGEEVGGVSGYKPRITLTSIMRGAPHRTKTSLTCCFNQREGERTLQMVKLTHLPYLD